jgi:hypothetical protein
MKTSLTLVCRVTRPLTRYHYERKADRLFSFSPADSEMSTESDYDPSNETLGERLYALRDIIPPQTRATIANTVGNTTDVVKSVLSFSGKTMWVIATSALILGVPWALAWAEEQSVMEMEKEMRMREMGGEVSSHSDGNVPLGDWLLTEIEIDSHCWWRRWQRLCDCCASRRGIRQGGQACFVKAHTRP